jgi:hypothetical protein
MFESAGFFNALSMLPSGGRGTHPSKKWGDSALDYIMTLDFKPVAPPLIISGGGLSDHNAVFAVFEAGR